MSFVDLAPDHRLFYQSFAGREDRPWLIFLHEGLGSVAQWKNFPERICQRTDCPALLYDRPSPATAARRPRVMDRSGSCAVDRAPVTGSSRSPLSLSGKPEKSPAPRQRPFGRIKL